MVGIPLFLEACCAAEEVRLAWIVNGEPQRVATDGGEPRREYSHWDWGRTDSLPKTGSIRSYYVTTNSVESVGQMPDVHRGHVQ